MNYSLRSVCRDSIGQATCGWSIHFTAKQCITKQQLFTRKDIPKRETMSYDPNQTPLVAETLLKKRRSLDELAVARAENLKTHVKRRRVVRGENIKIKRPEQFLKKTLTRENSRKKYERKLTSITPKQLPKATRDTVGFVVRILGGKNASDEVKAALGRFGLNKKYDGAFVKFDKKNLEKLKALEDYIAYGYISLKLVEELVHRRAFIFNEEGNKIPLSDNLVVEEKLGKFNMLCLSDLSHEIYTVGPHFMQAVRFLAPFALSSPVGGFDKKTLHVAADQRRFLGDGMEQFLEKIL